MTILQNLIRSDMSLGLEDGDGILSEAAQTLRRRNHPSERDQMMAKRVLFPFRGDIEPDDNVGNDLLPPIAWTMIWGGTYSSLYGAYASDGLRRVGYVFWDVQTILESWGDRVLWIEWKERWRGRDPRDTLEVFS